MGFFSKRKNEDTGFIILNTDDENTKISGEQNLAPHAMTPDEVSNLWVLGDDTPNTTQTSALDALKKRMNVSSESASEPKEEKQIKKEQEQSSTAPAKSSVTSNEEDKKSLVEKVKRYTIDEHGNDAAEVKEPLYKLESVAEILLNDSESAIKNLSQKYDIFIDDLAQNKTTKKEQEKVVSNDTVLPKEEKSTYTKSATPTFEQMVNDATIRETQQIYDSLFQTEKAEIKQDIPVPDISDIDTYETGINNATTANTATIRFTPVKDVHGNTDHITVSSVTKHIDLGDVLYEDISSQSTGQNLEQSEFEKFVPKYEVTDKASGKTVMRRFAIKKRSSFISLFLSAISTIALLVFLIPPIFDFIIGNPKSAILTCVIFLLVSVLANISMFTDFKYLLQKRSGSDILTALCSVTTLLFSISATRNQEGNAYYIILLCSIILLVRSHRRFKNISQYCSNLKPILSNGPLKAVSLISDPSTTHAMVKNSIEGDALVAAGRQTNFANDYIKHIEFSRVLSGKCSLIFYCTLIFSAISALMAYFYYQSAYMAFYSAAVICCIISMPSLFFINSLPLSAASKKLNAKGAMIAGMHGAERIELTNAAVVNINDIFPSGTIKMYSMKVLSDNNIDDTILRAASLTAAVNSPLESIFKQIAGTNSSYTLPDSDTVKYEKNLGISGWVNNELLFIGNRSLMQAHGIAIPSLEIDKKILRKGYFPVYVATADTACALIVIQYNVKSDIAKNLRKVTDLGLTLLVENCDQNITEEMLCDYFGLYENSVKILSNAGVHMCKSTTMPVNECSAPAVYKGSNLNLIKIINCASMIKKSNKILTILYSVFAILGVMYFIYSAFSGFTTIPAPSTILAYELIIALLSIIGFLIRKP